MGFSIGLLQLEVISALEQGAADSLTVAWIHSRVWGSIPTCSDLMELKDPEPLFLSSPKPGHASSLCCSVPGVPVWGGNPSLVRTLKGLNVPQLSAQAAEGTHSVLPLYIYLSELFFFSHQTKP